MTLGDRIDEQLGEHAQVLKASRELLVPGIARAVDCMVAALSEDHKIIACANAPGNAECERLVSVLVGRFERERLALPALVLSAVRGQELAGPESEIVPQFARQIEGLGRAGDVLVALSVTGECLNVIDAIERAHERQMHVVAITGNQGGALALALQDGDVHLAIPSERTVVVEAMQRIVLNALCDGIDWNFLGDES